MDDKEKKEKVPPNIRTMQTDAQLYIQKKQLSALDIKSKTYIAQSGSPLERVRNIRPFILWGIGIVLVMAASLAAWQYIVRESPQTPGPANLQTPVSYVRVEGENPITFIATNPVILLEGINTERSKIFPQRHLIYLPIEKRHVSQVVGFAKLPEIFSALGWQPPPAFQESITGDFNFLLFSQKNKNKFAFIIRIKTFDRLFSALLGWEKTMARDWRNILENDLDLTSPQSFNDKIIQNHDARVLSLDGKIVLAYAIFNKRFLIIATSEEALTEILDRMLKVPPQ